MPIPFPSHVEWIADRMGAALVGEIRRQGWDIDVREVLGILCGADPSPGKVAVQWMAERLLDGGFLWEDVRSGAGSKVHETLVAFWTHRRSLDRASRSLAAHPTLASAWSAVEPLLPRSVDAVDEPGIRERRRRERAAAHAESIVLCERPGLTVAVPLTEAASKWWGRGTRWCTAAENGNAFDSYNDRAPLIVAILRDEKLQLFVDGRGRAQFMNSADGTVSSDLVASHWNEIGPFVLWAVGRSPDLLGLVPECHRDRALCIAAVIRAGHMLAAVPKAILDREMCLAAVARDGRALQDVPPALRDRDTCQAAVAAAGSALEFVPAELVDRAMCDLAIRRWGRALAHVPEAMRDRNTCLAAVAMDGKALASVPMALRDHDICLAALRNDGLVLDVLPERLRSRDLCLAAVSQTGYAVGMVPRDVLDRDLCLAAVEQHGGALMFVPDEMRDAATCLAAVKQSGGVLDCVPEALRDVGMCLAAVTSDGAALECVPQHLLSRDLCLVALRNGGGLRGVPPSMLDSEMCLVSVSRRGWTLGMVPEALKDLEMCRAAFLQDNRALNFVPDALVDEVRAAILLDPAPWPVPWSAEDALEGLAQALAADWKLMHAVPVLERSADLAFSGSGLVPHD